MTLKIELNEQEYAELQSDAATVGLSPEQLAHRSVVERPRPTAPSDIDDSTFRAAMTASFRENDELYRRLAK